MPNPLYTRNARGLPVDLHTRGGKPVITGYAAVFYNPADPGTEYRMFEDMVERIMPGAFDKTLREGDVRALFNHRDDNILGRVRAGTLRVWTDQRGLKYEIDPPDTTAGRDVVESIRRGDVTGSSFMFRPVSNTYRDVDGLYIVERNAVELYDVGPVTFPAYTATDTGVRAEVNEWIKSRSGISHAAVKARARAVEVMLAMAN
ncbi:Caudovirus prohead protease [Gemmata obscuriglobus]|uniref:HK97 family phage prohead protease n=1 Tax=Gemmata obscuriglobus TaxID=114 RepID=A0A2Z3H013_9BACT